jgi:hypothetical protein
MRAARQLPPICVEGEKESTRFTELFRAAPEWLLWFTGVPLLDAPLLKFNLPKPRMTPRWGSEGYKETINWPLLPLGRMTDGRPISKEEALCWPFLWPGSED